MANHDETSPLLANSHPSSDNSSTSSNDIRNHNINGSTNGHLEQRNDEENPEEQESQETPYEGLPEVRKQLKFIVPAVAIGIFLAAADQTIVASAYGTIGSDLNALNKTSWISTGYFLTSTSFQPLYGKLSDIFGRKPVLLFAYGIFGMGCLFCGLATNIDELIVARSIAGIGGGGMTLVVSVMVSDIVPLRERGTWQGVLNIIFAAGSGCGAPLGGLLSDTIGWRWAFLAQAPLCTVAFLAVVYVLKLPKIPTSDWKTKLWRVDFLGAFVLIGAVFTLLLGLDRGSNVAWKAPISIASLCASFILFILFLIVEQKAAVEPFAPGRIIFAKTLIACYICNFFSFAGLLAVMFYLPLYFQAVDGFTATQAGVRLLPAILGGVSGSLFSGVVMQRTGKYYWLTVIAYTALTLAVIPILLFTGLVASNIYGILIGLVVAGLSNGIGVTTTLISLIANVSPKDQALATASSYLFRSLGSIVGLSLSATVVQQTLQAQLRDRLKSGNDADHIVKKVQESLEYIKTLEPGTREVVRECYAVATRNGFAFMLGLVSIAMFASLFIKEKKLGK